MEDKVPRDWRAIVGFTKQCFPDHRMHSLSVDAEKLRLWTESDELAVEAVATTLK